MREFSKWLRMTCKRRERKDVKMFEITQEEVKQTIEFPDKVMDAKEAGVCCYLKKFRGKAELLVVTEWIEGDNFKLKCFGWVQGMMYPSGS